MSSQDGPDAAAIVQLYSSKYVSRYLFCHVPSVLSFTCASASFVDNAIEVAAAGNDLPSIWRCRANIELIPSGLAALLVYEYLVTLNQEIQLFWARRARAASLLFFTIRYWTLLNYVVFWSLDVAAAHFSDEVRARMRISRDPT